MKQTLLSIWRKGGIGILLLMASLSVQGEPYPILHDSSYVDIRSFDPESLEEYRNDPDFQYDPQVVELSWLKRIGEWFGSLFPSGTGSAFWNIFGYLLAGAAFFIIIFGILKLKPAGFFTRGGKGETQLEFEELDDNIHEMDFESLIREAASEQSFRRGVRLLYLETLKELTQHEWIDWQKHKTNQDYQLELAGTGIRSAFDDLTLRYEYVWYGDFPIDQQGFRAMEGIFRGFQQGVKRT